MRAFFCVELDETIQKELERIVNRLRHQVTTRVSWVRRENLHVTLKFLGEIDPASLPQFQQAAAEACRGIAPFDWQLNRLGAFPHVQRPRVIWAGCHEEPQPLQALYASLERQLQARGHPPERGAFTAHVTLGRVKEGGPRSMEIARALENIPAFAYELRTEGLTLMESQLTPGGAIYRPCCQWALHGSSR